MHRNAAAEPSAGPQKNPKDLQKPKTENRKPKCNTNKWNKAKFIFEKPKPSPKKSFANTQSQQRTAVDLALPLFFSSLLLRRPSLSLTRRLLNGLSGNHWHRARNDNNNSKSSNNTKKRQAKNQWKISKQTEEAAGRIKKNGRRWRAGGNLGKLKGTEGYWEELRGTEKNWEKLRRTAGNWEEPRWAAKH